MRERDWERRVEGSLLSRDIEFHGNFAAALIRRVELQSNVGLAVALVPAVGKDKKIKKNREAWWWAGSPTILLQRDNFQSCREMLNFH